jgi:hypothetical protein
MGVLGCLLVLAGAAGAAAFGIGAEHERPGGGTRGVRWVTAKLEETLDLAYQHRGAITGPASLAMAI